MNYTSFTERLRKDFELRLGGPGISWNKNGILTAFELSVTSTLVKILDEEASRKHEEDFHGRT